MGILATGNIAARFAEDLRLVPDAELVAVGSRTAESAELFADRHGVARAYGSWAELAADDEVDVVYVATPHAAHYEATMTCLTAGRAVLVEKPFTLDLATSTELIETARARGVFLMEAMWMRTNPLILRVVELIADGAIGDGDRRTGRLRGGRAVPAGAPDAGPDAGRRRAARPGRLPGQPGPPAARRAGPRPVLGAAGPEGVDENTGIVFGYDSGAVATLSCGMVGATPLTASITGTTGRIDLPEPFFRPGAAILHRAGRRAGDHSRPS